MEESEEWQAVVDCIAGMNSNNMNTREEIERAKDSARAIGPAMKALHDKFPPSLENSTPAIMQLMADGMKAAFRLKNIMENMRTKMKVELLRRGIDPDKRKSKFEHKNVDIE